MWSGSLTFNTTEQNLGVALGDREFGRLILWANTTHASLNGIKAIGITYLYLRNVRLSDLTIKNNTLGLGTLYLLGLED